MEKNDWQLRVIGGILILVGIALVYFGYKESQVRITWDVNISPWLGVGIVLIIIGGYFLAGKLLSPDICKNAK